MQVSLEQARELLANLQPDVQIEMTTTEEGIKLLVLTDPEEPTKVVTGRKGQTKEDILREEYGHLLDNKLTLTEAAAKYDVPRGTLSSWVYITGYLERVDKETYPLTVNEAEIAYLVDIYRRRRETGSKAPLVDEQGRPYDLLHPDLADYRRKKRRRSLADDK